MSETNAEVTKVETTDATAVVTNDEVKEAVQKSGYQLPDNPTGKDFAEMINALPDRIVDALKEATVSKQTTETKEVQKSEGSDDSKGGFFGYKDFASWWTGNK